MRNFPFPIRNAATVRLFHTRFVVVVFFVLLHFANNDKYALNDNHGKWWPQFAQFTPDTNCAQIICGAQIE